MRSFKTFAQGRRTHLLWEPGDLEVLSGGSFPVSEDASGLQIQNHVFPRQELDNHAAHRAGFDKAQQSAWQEYKAWSFDLNRALKHQTFDLAEPRNGEELHMANQVKQLDHVTSLPSATNMAVYRGFSRSFPIHELTPGSTFKYLPYTSTSRFASAALKASFAHPAGHEFRIYKPVPHDHPLADHHTIAAITMPPGTRGHIIDHPEIPGHGYSHEGEFLVARGTTYQVTHHTLGHPFPYGLEGPRVEALHPRAAKVHLVHMRVVDQ